MPELPEVETMARGVRPVAVGRTIVRCTECPCACRPISQSPRFPQFARRVMGRTVADVRRIAKRAVIDLSSGDSIVIEPRMTGLLLVADPPDREHLRIQWDLEGNGTTATLWFWDRRGLGTVRLVRTDRLDAILSAKLGRDALAMRLDDWEALCRGTRQPIKVALLDQRKVAGIGNLYASEILHFAGIAPQRPANDLRSDEIARLHEAAQSILLDAIACEGSTLGDATYRTALSVNGTYQNRHRVYKKAGEACPTCSGGAIVRIVQAQRATFYCPQCQSERPDDPRGFLLPKPRSRR